MTYSETNEAKAQFDEVYCSPTPHAYLAEMCRHGYQIGEQARPYGLAAARLLQRRNHDAWPVQMLDLGCSYGLGSAFLKYGCSFEEIVAFFHGRAPRDPQACSLATRAWLNVVPPLDMRVVGLDSSENAIRFGLDSGLLDGGLARDLERPDAQLSSEELAWVRGCNLLSCTGAIGYVTERTLDRVLPEFGQDHHADFGPLAFLTILRMFDPEPVSAAFTRSGWSFTRVEGIRLAQRAFVDRAEQDSIVEELEARGLDTREWERRGVLYADLFAAARDPETLGEFDRELQSTARSLRDVDPLFASHAQVATTRPQALAAAASRP